MTVKEAAQLVALAAANFPNMQDKELKPTAMLWAKLLADIPYHIAEQALIKVLMSAKFFPTVADIREGAEQLLKVDKLPEPEEAWLEVFRQLDPYKRPEYSHPEIKKAVQAIGYMNLCNSENIAIERAQFMKIYGCYKKRTEEERENEKVFAFTSGMLKAIPGGRG